MANIFVQLGETAWDMVGLSSQKRNAAFLKEIDPELEYTPEQHAAYEKKMVALGYKPKSLPNILYHGRANMRDKMRFGHEEANETFDACTMVNAVSALAQATGQDFSAGFNKPPGPDYIFTMQKSGEAIYSRDITGDWLSLEEFRNPWLKPGTSAQFA